MKKVLFFLFFICIFMVPAFADYTVDSIFVSAEVASSGKSQVSMTLQLTFDASTPEVTVPLPEDQVSKVSAGDYRFQLDRTDDGTDVILKNREGFIGTQTFLITYQVPAAVDNDAVGDAYHLGLLSTRWAKPIGSCAFQVVLPGGQTAMPEDFTLEPQVLSGYHKALTLSETGLSISGNTISGAVADRMAYDSLALELTLPEGYFLVRSTRLPGIAITWLSLAMLLIWLLAMLYWRLRIRTPHTASEPRLLAPEGVLPCQLPMVLDGGTCDVVAIILEWANLGYLSISVNRRGLVILTRLMQMGSERGKSERMFFDRIFGSRQRVAATPGRFSGAAARFRGASRRTLSRVIFDRRGGNLIFVQTPCRLLLSVGIGYMAVQALPEGGGFVVLGILLGLVGLIYSLYLHSALVRFFALRTASISSAILCLLLLPLLLGGLLSGAFLEILIGILACLFSALVSARGPRRSQRGMDAMAQARGCRTFYRRVTWQRLQILQGENRRFFQLQLPSAVALGVDQRFARRFEQLPIPMPEWLRLSGSSVMTASSLQRQLSPILRQLRNAFR